MVRSFIVIGGEKGKTFFTSVGLGIYTLRNDNGDVTDPGLAILLGCGYEFSAHWQVSVYLFAGETSQIDIINVKHTHVSILVSGVAF